MLRDADVGSVVRRAPGFDVPEFMAAGPRHVLVAASDVAVAQDVLRGVDPAKAEPRLRSSADRRSRLFAALLIPVALMCSSSARSRRAHLSDRALARPRLVSE